MATQNDKEDTAYNRDVLHAIAESRTTIERIRDTMTRAINLLHNEVVALQKIVERWQWITIILFIGFVVVVALLVISRTR